MSIPKGQEAGKIHKGDFLLLFWKASVFCILRLWKNQTEGNQNTGTKDCSVHEVGVALGVREEGLWPNSSILSFIPSDLVIPPLPARAARRVPRVPACQSRTVPGGRAAALATAQGIPPARWQHVMLLSGPTTSSLHLKMKAKSKLSKSSVPTFQKSTIQASKSDEICLRVRNSFEFVSCFLAWSFASTNVTTAPFVFWLPRL